MTTLQELQGYATQVQYSRELPKSAKYYKSDFYLSETEYTVFDIFVSIHKNSIKYYFKIVPGYIDNSKNNYSF